MADSGGDLVLEQVTKTYTGWNDVLRGVSLTVGAGESVSVIGPSGCGKSTLLNIMGSLDRPTTGVVRLGEIDVSALAGDALAAYRSSEVGFVFQDHHLLPQLTALENVLLPSLAKGSEDGTERTVGLLRAVGLLGQADSYPAQMSGGERQRVAIARSMINRPRLLLCDEPTGNLDQEAGRNVVSLFLRLARESGVTVVMATHNLDLASAFSRRLKLRAGRLVESDSGGAA